MNQFAYLLPVANSYCHEMVCRHEFEAFVRSVTANQLAELTAVYEEIDRRADAAKISDWVHECKQLSTEGETSYLEEVCACETRRLFRLFDYLGAAQIPPFSSHRVVFVERNKEPNWDDVPSEFRYLIDAAKLHRFHSGSHEDFQYHAGEVEHEIMARTAQMVRENGGVGKIMDWFLEHEEFWCIGLALALLEACGYQLS